MKNTQGVLKNGIKLKIKNIAKENETIVEFMLNAFVGLLSSCAVVFSSLSPFGLCALAVTESKNILPALCGVVLGYVLSGQATMRYIAAAALIIGVKWLVEPYIEKPKRMLFACLTAFGATLVTGLAVYLSDGFTVFNVVMVLSESLLALGAAFFFARTKYFLAGNLTLKNAGGADICSIIVSLAVLLIALSRVTIQSVSVGRVIAVLAILICARYGKEAVGSIVGISTGTALCMLGSEYGYLIGAYGLGGLLAGVFSPFGRLGCSVAFILANAAASVIFGNAEVILPGLYEVMAGTILFMVLPESILGKLSFSLSQNELASGAAGIKSTVCLKLDLASKALGDVCKSVETVSQKLAKGAGCDYTSVCTKTTDTVCRKCGLRYFCWDKAYNETMNAYNDMISFLKDKQPLTREDVPDYFATRCCKLSEVLSVMNSTFTEEKTSAGASKMVGNVRSVVVDQYDGVAKMLNGICKELEETEFFDNETALKVRDTLQSFGFKTGAISCQIDKFGRMTVDACVKNGGEGGGATVKLTKAVCEACDRLFDLPSFSPVGDFYKFSFYEKAVYCVDVGVAQISYQNAGVCGDAFESFADGKGRTHLIISDGMGNGTRAAIDGTMAAGLLSQLIKAGFSFDAALKIVNSALLVKSDEESLATLDVCCFDMFTGRAEFLKAGAAPSFIRKNTKVGRVESSSMPVGILHGVSFEKSSITLNEGDIVLMISDGVIETGSYDWIYAELESFRPGSAQQLAEKIASQAKARRYDGHEDDITVMAALVSPGV